MYSKEKQFAFLGVYSSHLQDNDGLYEYGLGRVWYGHLVEEVATNGITYMDLTHGE